MRRAFGENIAMALGAVMAHKIRSLLTVLGIVVGITTVVTVGSLLTGLRQGIVTFFEELGPDNIFVKRFSGDPGSNGRPNERTRRPIDPEVVQYLKALCPSVEDVGVGLFVTPGDVRRNLVARVEGFDTDRVNIVGDSHNLSEISPSNYVLGRTFTQEEAMRGEKIVVLGHNIAEALFPNGEPIGREVILDGAAYRVIGVREKAKGGFFGENGIDNQASIPLKTAQLRYPALNRYMIIAKARPGQRQEAFDEVENIMRRLRRLAPGAPNDFDVSTPDQIIEQFDSITGLVIIASVALSGLGLLVGGIGVMNIMLVSVTERTREIGVRKAIGARRFDIVFQFLTEAVTLTGVGGLLGIGTSILITMLVGFLVPSLPSVVPAWALATGFSVSVAIGIFFGVWPAVKAARLDPVEALRYE